MARTDDHVRVTVRLPRKLAEALEKKAATDGKAINQLVTQAVRQIAR